MLFESFTSVNIEDEMKSSYLDYAMSVIIGRALPDLRDGCKPVHRRILYLMHENSYFHTKPYKKSSRIVGDVMGKYHPHGDLAIYDAMVRMIQDFSLSFPLIQGQGNFGSLDGDSPAAMRYTEARLAEVSQHLLEDLEKETVDFRPNYDESLKEPIVLPAQFPNLLVNGSNGIAVGMATNIPTHNFNETLKICIAYLQNRNITIEELLKIMPGPDFPTGAILIASPSELKSIYTTGRGTFILRSVLEIQEEKNSKTSIIITEIPYQVNKSKMLEKIAECVRNKTIEGISDIRDESNRAGVRVVIELKRDALPDIVVANLYRHTNVQISYSPIMLAIDKNEPKVFSLHAFLDSFTSFREQIIIKRSLYLLKSAQKRSHIIAGLLICLCDIDLVIATIRNSATPKEAKEKLSELHWNIDSVEGFKELIDSEIPDDENVPVLLENSLDEEGMYRLSDQQIQAILDMKLHRLTGIERETLKQETLEIIAEMKEYRTLIQFKEKRIALMIKEFETMDQAFVCPRRTKIELMTSNIDLKPEDLIPNEEELVSVTCSGYVKRVPLSVYRSQNRGGKGKIGVSIKEKIEDAVRTIFVTTTHACILFFSSIGKVYKLPVYKIPAGTSQSRGKSFMNFLPLEKEEAITTSLPLPEEMIATQKYPDALIFSLSNGKIRRSAFADFINVNASGKIAIGTEEEEEKGCTLISVASATDQHDILLATQRGYLARFSVSDLRTIKSRNSTGIKGINLNKNDKVIAMAIILSESGKYTAEERRLYTSATVAERRLRSQQQKEQDIQESDDEDDVMITDIPDSTSLTTDHELLFKERRERLTNFEAMKNQEEFLLSVTEKGMGMICSCYDFSQTSRGCKGVKNMLLSRDDAVVFTSLVNPQTDEIILVTNSGQVIRIPVSQIRFVSRNSKGVHLLKMSDSSQKIVSVSVINQELDEEENTKESESIEKENTKQNNFIE